VSSREVRVLGRHLILTLAEDFDLAEVADVLALAAQLARRAVEIAAPRQRLDAILVRVFDEILGWLPYTGVLAKAPARPRG
jgi:hypothetical protein